MRFSFCLLLYGLLLYGLPPPLVAAEQIGLKFCYEDKTLYPYYLGQGFAVAEKKPGATIEHLQQLVAQVPQLRLELQRQPWKRCLAALQLNEVDAVVASYRPDRADIGRYPMLNAKPDPKRAFAEHHTCLVSRPDATWRWDGKNLIGINEIVIGRPLGYAPLRSPPGQKFQMHYTLSGTMDLDLLEKGRIHAVTTLCQISGIPFTARPIRQKGLTVLYPPLYGNTGFLLFSHGFYQQHPLVAEQLWRALASNRGSAIYQRYLNE